ncbi:MAG: DNA mismatch repair protein MutS [Bacteroidales bacterium]|nr:DNA mismatch repair protein MutS [Bacteroidales bacterium]
MGERNLNTPLMKQYVQFKAQYPQAVLLMRVGDFYEAYGDDAITVSKVLGIVLTKRSNGVPSSMELCGFPHHSLQTYLPKLVRAGYKVAVCDQLEDPKMTKTLVKRGVTELVTPGVAYNDDILDRTSNNYLASFAFEGEECGVAFLDVSTGTFKVAQGKLDFMDVLLSDMSPKEVLLKKGYEDGFRQQFGQNWYITPMDEWAFVEEACFDKLEKQFGQKALKGFGIEKMRLAKTAAGAVLFYLEQNRISDLASFDAVTIKGQSGTFHINSISRIDRGNFVWLDRFTVKNLEIFQSFSPDGVSLMDVADKTVSPMGARLLRSWIAMPLLDPEKIEQRYDAVEFFLKHQDTSESIRQSLENVGDMERILSRASTGKITPREMVMLHRSLAQTKPIAEALEKAEGRNAVEGKIPSASVFYRDLEKYEALDRLISSTIKEDAAAVFGKGEIIASGVDATLDELRKISTDSKDYLLQMQQRESERTGIPSLKISYNNVFGYYLEVRNTYKSSVPQEWIRKQTLVNAERYITPELKEYEEKILGAEEKIISIEQKIFLSLVVEIQKNIPAIQGCCRFVSEVDCLLGFARLARERNYCRPSVDNSLRIEIEKGRHPVLETRMEPGQEYVANDLMLDNENQQIIILTGPNMSGKSALLRQTALIVLLAQCGCFVPAKSAKIGIVDKIFTRVGASDNISQGESTFMVEMLETSAILHNITDKSLVLLDEIGRGTSTFDGMSIAWAIVEYLHQNRTGHPKTIFATHYHELNELEDIYPRVKNFHIEVKESGKEIIFLRHLKPGGVAHSFGIHVARLAGMPEPLLDSAEKMLSKLEKQEKANTNKSPGKQEDPMQLSFFQLDDPTLSAIKTKLEESDLNNMTPLQAFDLLRSLKSELGL